MGWFRTFLCVFGLVHLALDTVWAWYGFLRTSFDALALTVSCVECAWKPPMEYYFPWWLGAAHFFTSLAFALLYVVLAALRSEESEEDTEEGEVM